MAKPTPVPVVLHNRALWREALDHTKTQSLDLCFLSMRNLQHAVYVHPRAPKAEPYANEVIASVAKACNAILIEEHEQIPGTPAYDADTSRFKPAGTHLMAERVSGVLLHTPAVRQLFAARKNCAMAVEVMIRSSRILSE